MADFVLFIPTPEALVRGVVLPGVTAPGAVRLTEAASTAAGAIGSAGESLGLGVAAWFGLGVSGFQTIADLGSAFVGFGSDVAGSGPAVVVALTNGAGHARAARFPVDPRAVGLRSLELRWVQGFSGSAGMLDLFADGVAVPAAAEAGADLPLAAHAGAMGLGGTLSTNAAIQRAMALHPSVVGTGWADTPGGGGLAGSMTGGLAYFTLERSPGLPLVWMEFGDTLADAMGTLSPAWVGSEAAGYADAGTAEPPPDPVDPPPGGNPNPLDVAAWKPAPGIPLLRQRVFRGDRFRLAFPVLAAEPESTLEGVQVRAQVRAAPGGPLVHEFVPIAAAQPGGTRFVLLADTDAWPLGTVLCDVTISGPGIPETLAFRVWVRVVRRQ